MTSILLSEADSRLGRAVRDLFLQRGVTLAVADDGTKVVDAAVLVITDLAPALMARALPAGSDPAHPAPGPDRLARLEALVVAAAARGCRIVLVSGVQPVADAASGAAAGPAAGHGILQIETVVSARAAERTVILRVSDVMDPADPELRAAVRALIDGSPAATWPSTYDLQGIGLADLAAATVAAALARGVEGKWFDIVHPGAVSRVALQSEAQRIARLLLDPDAPEGQVRPTYAPVIARRDGSAGAEALHVRPRASVFVLLAQAIQGMIADSVRQGTIPPIQAPMPAVHRALETGALPLAGCCAVVTGATGKIGQSVTRMLVRLGADVIGVARRADAGRDMERACADEWEMLDRQRKRLDAARVRRDGSAPVTGAPGRFRFVPADLSDTAALKDVARRLTAEAPRIDVLIHLAGEMRRERRETAQKIELVLALQTMAPVALTRLLAGSLGRAKGAWVINPVARSHLYRPYDLNDLQSRQTYLPSDVLARAHSGLVALTGALAQGMTGTGVNIAAIVLPQVHTPFRDKLEEPLPDGRTADHFAKIERDRRRAQMETPARAASQLIEVLLAQDFAQAHGCLIMDGAVSGPILTADLDRANLISLWGTVATLSGLPE